MRFSPPLAAGTLTVEPALLVAGLLLAVAILATRVSLRLGVPALLLFLGTGMLAGSDGIGGIWFDDPSLSWSVGVVALAVLLYSSGLDTDARHVRPVLGPGLTLASVGVAVSTLATAAFTRLVFGWPLLEGLLLGAIVSSTDAAAVFGVLRSAGLRLRGRIQPILELESGSNDPMAIFLTLAATGALLGTSEGPLGATLGFALQMGVGALTGLLGGRAMRRAINRLSVPQEGLFPVFTLGLGLALFGATALLHGSGFLAVYLAGMTLGSGPLMHRRSILRFHDALAWLVQIGIFVTLGLLVFPSRLPEVAPEGLAVAAFLLLVARPLAVAVSLSPFRVPWREQAMIAWVGLRGAVPILLAIWPRVAGVPGADQVFDIVFFVVVVSVFVQGVSLPWVARLLGVGEPTQPAPGPAIEHHAVRTLHLEVGPAADGRPLYDLDLPRGALIAVLERDGDALIPEGETLLRAGDRAQVVVDAGQEDLVRQRLDAPEDRGPPPSRRSRETVTENP